MSKRTMNEVIYLAENLCIQVYHQDTDSMHILRNEVPILADAFETKYNRELFGSQLGQFHSDFSGINQDGYEVYAIKSYFIWMRVNIDKLSKTSAIFVSMVYLQAD